MNIKAPFGTIQSHFGIDIENIDVDPLNELRLSDEDRDDMRLALAELHAVHAKGVLYAACPDAGFVVFPSGEITFNRGADLSPLYDSWDTVSDAIKVGPDADEIDRIIDFYRYTAIKV